MAPKGATSTSRTSSEVLAGSNSRLTTGEDNEHPRLQQQPRQQELSEKHDALQPPELAGEGRASSSRGGQKALVLDSFLKYIPYSNSAVVPGANTSYVSGVSLNPGTANVRNCRSRAPTADAGLLLPSSWSAGVRVAATSSSSGAPVEEDAGRNTREEEAQAHRHPPPQNPKQPSASASLKRSGAPISKAEEEDADAEQVADADIKRARTTRSCSSGASTTKRREHHTLYHVPAVACASDQEIAILPSQRNLRHEPQASLVLPSTKYSSDERFSSSSSSRAAPGTTSTLGGAAGAQGVDGARNLFGVDVSAPEIENNSHQETPELQAASSSNKNSGEQEGDVRLAVLARVRHWIANYNQLTPELRNCPGEPISHAVVSSKKRARDFLRHRNRTGLRDPKSLRKENAIPLAQIVSLLVRFPQQRDNLLGRLNLDRLRKVEAELKSFLRDEARNLERYKELWETHRELFVSTTVLSSSSSSRLRSAGPPGGAAPAAAAAPSPTGAASSGRQLQTLKEELEEKRKQQVHPLLAMGVERIACKTWTTDSRTIRTHDSPRSTSEVDPGGRSLDYISDAPFAYTPHTSSLPPNVLNRSSAPPQTTDDAEVLGDEDGGHNDDLVPPRADLSARSAGAKVYRGGRRVRGTTSHPLWQENAGLLAAVEADCKACNDETAKQQQTLVDRKNAELKANGPGPWRNVKVRVPPPHRRKPAGAARQGGNGKRHQEEQEPTKTKAKRRLNTKKASKGTGGGAGTFADLDLDLEDDDGGDDEEGDAGGVAVVADEDEEAAENEKDNADGLARFEAGGKHLHAPKLQDDAAHQPRPVQDEDPFNERAFFADLDDDEMLFTTAAASGAASGTIAAAAATASGSAPGPGAASATAVATDRSYRVLQERTIKYVLRIDTDKQGAKAVGNPFRLSKIQRILQRKEVDEDAAKYDAAARRVWSDNEDEEDDMESGVLLEAGAAEVDDDDTGSRKAKLTTGVEMEVPARRPAVKKEDPPVPIMKRKAREGSASSRRASEGISTGRTRMKNVIPNKSVYETIKAPLAPGLAPAATGTVTAPLAAPAISEPAATPSRAAPAAVLLSARPPTQEVEVAGASNSNLLKINQNDQQINDSDEDVDNFDDLFDIS
eukprot:CAMPEP_0178985238 /NCGR_PEP_ID=MMETSP0795-20121207/2042_1 /TAXON_ID=88552 /ORGANISM="Amoebophrya sp., Strain Ameob2" /LENGTH=1126 /DNA_ID=CAMNT_0020676175 /DNA_START=30 /DNA_END=3411 /DNA_ORIENTATION=-